MPDIKIKFPSVPSPSTMTFDEAIQASGIYRGKAADGRNLRLVVARRPTDTHVVLFVEQMGIVLCGKATLVSHGWGGSNVNYWPVKERIEFVADDS